MSNLPEHVEQSIRTRKLFRRGERILVAVSGGVDSMVLLHLLHALAPEFGWKLIVAHFNHQLRGRASDGDEEFVKRVAKSLDLKAIVERGNVKAHAKQHGASFEMAARDLRHAFFARTARRLKIRSVALAHHADDQVELFFLRLLRGAGGEGIAGMKWSNPSPADSKIQLVRPMLNVSKTDVEEFARENKIRFRDDASNTSLDIQRNRIRHELLPLLKSRYQPALVKTVLRTMDIIGAEAETVTDAAQAWLTLKPASISDWPVALQRRIIQLQLQHAGISSDFELIESLRLQPRKRINISPGVSIQRSESGRVQRITTTVPGFDARHETTHLKGHAGTMVFDGVQFRWRTYVGSGSALGKSQPQREIFDADKVGSHMVLRHWHSGDRFQPIGMIAPVKLQDWFTNQKIPRARRHELLVAESASGEIFWVEGLRISENFKLTSSTGRRLFWRWLRS